MASDEESTTFEMIVRPKYEFFQQILQQTDQIEIIEPQWVKEEMHHIATNILSYHKKPVPP